MRVRLRLPESNRRRSRSTGGTVLSVTAHLVLIGAALYGTKGIEAHPVDDIEVPVLVYHPPRVPPAPTAAPAPQDAASDAPAVPTDPAAPPLSVAHTLSMAAPLHFETGPIDGIVPSTDVTTADFGSGVDGRPFGPPGMAKVPSGASVLSELEVERAVVLLDGAPSPRYPEALRAAGVRGQVVARFVVDTLGRVEAGSVRFSEATHAEFAESVRQVLPRLRFRPAEAGGRRVRQLVQQEFRFSLRD